MTYKRTLPILTEERLNGGHFDEDKVVAGNMRDFWRHKADGAEGIDG